VGRAVRLCSQGRRRTTFGIVRDLDLPTSPAGSRHPRAHRSRDLSSGSTRDSAVRGRIPDKAAARFLLGRVLGEREEDAADRTLNRSF